MAKKRAPLQQRAPPVPDFSDQVRKADTEGIERHMANFFADLNKKGDFDIVTTTLQQSTSATPSTEQKNSQEQKHVQIIQSSPTSQAPANPPAVVEVKKTFDKSKLDKISQMLAVKKQEGGLSASNLKVDLTDKLKNLFQKNGLASTTAISSSPQVSASSSQTVTSAIHSAHPPEKVNIAADPVILNKKEEYDPARPNDYDQLKRIINKQKQDLDKFKNKKSLAEVAGEDAAPSTIGNKSSHIEIEEDEEDDGLPMLGLGSKNAQTAVEKDTGDLYSKMEYESSEEKAFKLMSKQGFKLGQGLGKMSQGIVAPIIAQKISDTSAIITQSTMDLSTIIPQEIIMKRYFEQRNLVPTKVMCLINLVSPYEIDEDLEEEVTEECFQFGNVVNLKIYVMAAEDCEDAVRIFVKYEFIEEAMNAFTNMDGRIFNGRSVIGYFYSEEEFENNQLSSKLS